jgi:glycine cleavage system H protein
MEIKKDLMYTKDHEWIKKEGDFTYVGITDYAQHSLGDIVFVELPEVGDELETGDGFAVVESVKAVSDVYAPGSGTVEEVNEELEDSPELLNEKCYESFIAKFSEFEAEELMTAEQYEQFIAEEE